MTDIVPERLIPLREVRRIVSLSTATIYRMVAAGRFPRQTRISIGRVAWRATEVAEWQRAKWSTDDLGKTPAQ